jgi:hypothetical protein
MAYFVPYEVKADGARKPPPVTSSVTVSFTTHEFLGMLKYRCNLQTHCVRE